MLSFYYVYLTFLIHDTTPIVTALIIIQICRHVGIIIPGDKYIFVLIAPFDSRGGEESAIDTNEPITKY